MATSQDFVNWVCSEELRPRFLAYLLLAEKSSLRKFSSGAVHQTIYYPEAKAFYICLPPADEQERIVAILDEAFEGIGSAAANAEKNLANGRELFESYLNAVFAQGGEGWIEKRLGDSVSSVSTGPFGSMLHKNDYVEGGIPIVNPIHIDGERIRHSTSKTVNQQTAERLSAYRLRADDVVVGRRGEIGRCAVVQAEQSGWLCGTGCFYVRPSADLNPHFLASLLRSGRYREELERAATGATMKNLSNTSLRNLMIAYPADADAQYDMVLRLDELSTETKRLQEIYQDKLSTLAELKQSLLQKAFGGKLAADLPLPDALVSIKGVDCDPRSSEFAADVIAFIFDVHVRAHRERTFGHVKAQKCLHLVESICDLDLGRQPIKDAAGPNDFRHMLAAEEWAKAQQFFEFISRGDGYEFKKLPQFPAMLSKARLAVKPYQQELERVASLVLHMNTRQAEVFATAHAAWNNLILDHAETSDSSIIREARENWHPDKKKIPESEFRKAIQSIRNKSLVPTGKAKRVGGQGILL